MTEMTRETFRLADVFDKAWSVYGRKFVPFVALTLIAQLPASGASLLAGNPALTRTPADFARWATVAVPLYLITVICSSLATGAVVYGVTRELRGESFSISESLIIGLRRLLPILGVSLGVTLAFSFAFLLLVVPGIMVWCACYVAIPACVAERAGVFASLRRSSFLTRGHRWQIFGLLLLILVAGVIIGRLVGYGASFGGIGAVVAAGAAAKAVIGAFNGVIVAVMYYQLRVAKEGIEVDKIAAVFD